MIIFYILITSLVLRLINLNQSLWLDEAIGALVVKNMSFVDIATKFIVADNHPPLYYLLLKLWTNVFGYSEIAIRMPSVLFGVGIVYLVYKITKNKYATLLTATAPLLVYYSQEARMYMMAGFLATLAVYFFLKKNYFFLSITMVFLIFTDYVPVFLLPLFLIYSLLKKENVKKTFFSYVPLLVVGLLWLPIFLKQINTGRALVEALPAWQELAGGATFKQIILFWNKLILGRISFYPKEIYFLLIFISSIPFLFSFVKSFKKDNLLYILWFITPLVFGFLTSFIFPAFIYFRFIYVIPAFYILIGQTKNKILMTLMLLVNFLGLGIYYVDSRQQRESWREATNFVENSLMENEEVVFIYPEPFAPYKWYSKGTGLGLTSSISVSSVDLSKLKDVEGLYIFNYLEDLTDPNRITRNAIYKSGFTKLKTYSFNGVGEVEYLKK